jgi:ADP-heptose:LPS heptosyltransferase
MKPQPPPADRILIVKLRAIGDVLLSTVVLPALRKTYPSSTIVFLAESPAFDILRGNPYVNDIILYDRSTMGGIDLIRAVRRGKFDMVIDLFGNPRTALLTRLSGARHRVGFRFRGRTYAYTIVVNPRGNRVHNTRFNLDALDALGIPADEVIPTMPVGVEDERYVQGFLREAGLEHVRLVALHTGGGWYTKRWGAENFAAVADTLAAQYGVVPVVLWGPGEESDAAGIRGMMRRNVFVPPPTSLQQLAALLKRCDVLITNDSGPMHIAAAVGTRVIAIFGPTDPRLQGPVGPGHVVVRNTGLACLGCNLTRCPIGHPCMVTLSVEAVLGEARRFLSATRTPLP